MTDQQIFRKDMGKAGYELMTYSGRNFYKGYAVRCSKHEYQKVIRATTVDLQQDQLGMGLVLYPTTSMDSKEFSEIDSIEEMTT